MINYSILKKAAASLFLALAATTFVLAGEPTHSVVYRADTARSVLTWEAKKVGGKHQGTIKLSDGQVVNNHGALSGSFVINMNSLENTDIEPGKTRTKLETHLKSADFFDVQQFPESRFAITSVMAKMDTVTGNVTHQVKGTLTIKGITNQISFDASIVPEGDQLTCKGTAIVDRTLYGIEYGSKKFFKNIGDKMIEDEFTVTFHIVAVIR